MKLFYIVVVTLCIVVVNTMFVRKTKDGDDKKNRVYNYQFRGRTTTAKNRIGLLNVGFCKNMQETKPEPSMDPDGMSLWPWWYDDCEKLLKDEFVLNQKNKYLKPLHSFISNMKTQKNKTILVDEITDMMKKIEDYKNNKPL